jgi:hypothetical protein
MSDVSKGERVTVQVFSDASGAPAVVSYGRYTFAFDTLGAVKCNLVKPVSGSRIEHKIALNVCTKAYMAARDSVVDAAWLARNAAMYA